MGRILAMRKGTFRVIARVWMFINSHFHIPHGLTDVTITTRTVPFIDDDLWMFLSLWLKRLLICLVCQMTMKMYLNPMKLFNLVIKVLLSSSFLLQRGSLMKIFLRSLKRKLEIKSPTSCESFKNCSLCENKTLGVSRIYKGCFTCFDVAVNWNWKRCISSVKCASKTIYFPFGGDFWFPMRRYFSWFLVDSAVELAIIGKSSFYYYYP